VSAALRWPTHFQQSPPIAKLPLASQDRAGKRNDISDALHGLSHTFSVVLLIWVGEHVDSVVPLFNLLDVEEGS